jgi:hypothetical protein
LKFWRILGYNKDYVLRYYKLNKGLFACDSLSNETVQSIKDIEFDLYIAVFDRDVKECPALDTRFQERPDLFELVYSDENYRLYHLKDFQ